jgi:hypothetical protein
VHRYVGMDEVNPRQTRGLEIANKPDQIRRITSQRYYVKSQSGHGSYKVQFRGLGWTCTCPDFQYRDVTCKHIFSILFSLKLRREVEARVIQPITDIHTCIMCGSDQIVRDGLPQQVWRHSKVQLQRLWTLLYDQCRL